MARVHGLEHVKRLAAAAFAHDDAVGAHAEAVLHEVADRHGALAFNVGGARFEAHHVRLGQLQFGGVLHRHDALRRRDE